MGISEVILCEIIEKGYLALVIHCDYDTVCILVPGPVLFSLSRNAVLCLPPLGDIAHVDINPPFPTLHEYLVPPTV